MPQVTYYVAASLDGFIADESGGVDFLEVVNVPDEDYGYGDFYASMDGLVMGRRTYEQILRFGDWPYAKKPCWVCSHRSVREPYATTATSPDQVLREAIELDRLWLVGGGDLAAQFLRRQAIDRVILSVVPVILGGGVPLFAGVPPEVRMDRVTSRSFASGLLQQTFSVRYVEES